MINMGSLQKRRTLLCVLLFYLLLIFFARQLIIHHCDNIIAMIDSVLAAREQLEATQAVANGTDVKDGILKHLRIDDVIRENGFAFGNLCCECIVLANRCYKSGSNSEAHHSGCNCHSDVLDVCVHDKSSLKTC
nr:MAG TPA: hypothetical protein [Caudoviricetes sp.]